MLKTIAIVGFVLTLSWAPALAKAEVARGASLVEAAIVVDTENWFMQVAERRFAEQTVRRIQNTGPRFADD